MATVQVPFVGATPPSVPDLDDIWVDISGDAPVLKRWTGSAWAAAGGFGPGFHAHIGTAVPNILQAGTIVTWTAVDSDDLGMLGANSQDVRPPAAGLYNIGFDFQFNSATGAKAVLLYVNGQALYGHVAGAVQTWSASFLACPLPANALLQTVVSSTTAGQTLNVGRMSLLPVGPPFG